MLEHLPDGSYLSCQDDLAVRIIEAGLAMTGEDGSCVCDSYRLITTLSITAATRLPPWSGTTTSAGRSRPPTSPCGTPC